MSRSRMVDFWARAEEGQILEEKQFDLKVFWKNLVRITKKYAITYNAESLVPVEENYDLLDTIFAAGKELLVETGIYNITTGRIIRFEPWEVEETIALAHDTVTLGAGDDRIEVKYTGLTAEKAPPVKGRVLGPQSPDIIEKVFESFAKEPIIDHFHFQGIIENVNGVPAKPGSPFEMMQEVMRTGYAKTALKKAGRTNAYDGGSAPVSVQGMMVAFDRGWGKKESDGGHCYLMPPMKIDYEQMCRVFFYHLRDVKFWTTAATFIGGMDGPPEMAVVSAVATALAEQMLFNPPLQQFAASPADYSCPASREAIWTGFHAAAAFIKNTRCAYVRANPGGIITAGLGEEHFWEVGATALAATALNCVVSAGTGRQSAARDCAAGISGRFAGEVAHSAVGIEKAKANELVKRFLAKYEDKAKDKTLHKTGKNFQECYDLKRVVPNKWILDQMDKVKKEMREMDFDVM
ncbi:MAG: monomethylamine:corrinoid methyltransferase [Planctomycetota bacterium]